MPLDAPQQAALKAAWHCALIGGCIAFIVALSLGGLVFSLTRRYLCKREITLYGGDMLTLVSLGAAIGSLKLCGGLPTSIQDGTANALLTALVCVTFGGWVVTTISGRMPKAATLMLRFGIITFCAAVLALSGMVFDTVKLPLTTKFINLGSLALPITTIWIAFVTTAFQMTAKVPCLSLGIGAISSLTFALAAYALPQRTAPTAIQLSGITFGTCMGLLPWAMMLEQAITTFATSSAIGIMLGVISVAGALKNTAFLIIVVPTLSLGIPFIEATCALCDSVAAKGRPKKLSLFELLTSEGLIGRRLWIVLVLANAYLCVIAIALVALVKIHFALKVLVLFSLASLAFIFVYSLSRLLSQRQPTQLTIELLGIPISSLNWTQTIELIEQFIADGTPHLIATADTSAIVRAQEDDEFKRVLKEAALVTPDGIGVVMAARLLGVGLAQRISGIDLMDKLCAMAAKNGYRIFLLGARRGIAEIAARRLSRMYPGLQVVGTHHGYFGELEEREVVQMIRERKPHILFVAMGIPKQEKWIARHMNELGVPVCIGVGGSFDVYAGVTRRAPKWMQQMCLEWLYRALREPHRFKRLLAIPKLMIHVMKFLVRNL